jgi:hypothetical protein
VAFFFLRVLLTQKLSDVCLRKPIRSIEGPPSCLRVFFFCAFYLFTRSDVYSKQSLKIRHGLDASRDPAPT